MAKPRKKVHFLRSRTGKVILVDWDHAIAQLRKAPISRMSFWLWLCEVYRAEYADAR